MSPEDDGYQEWFDHEEQMRLEPELTEIEEEECND